MFMVISSVVVAVIVVFAGLNLLIFHVVAIIFVVTFILISLFCLFIKYVPCYKKKSLCYRYNMILLYFF